MDKLSSIFLSTLKCALFDSNDKACIAGGQSIDLSESKLFAEFSESDWLHLFRLSSQQGVLSIVYEIVSRLPKSQQPPRNLKIRWALSAEAIVNRHKSQLKTAAFLADLWARHNIQTIVMKGLAMGTYYPRPEQRECGDLDCFLSDNYDLGNQLCEQIGAKVSRDYYKDATIHYQGLMVENHRFFLPIRGNRRMKELERHLENIVLNADIRHISGTKLIIPTPDFNALFLSIHGLNHFLSEGIKIRHIIDWAMLLKAEQHNINWVEFYHWADKMHMTRFVDALTAISVEHFGLKVSNPAIHTTSSYAHLILEDTILHSDGIHNKGYSVWEKRWLLISNKFSFGWKYHKIYQRSIIAELIRTSFAFLFEKHPKL